MRERAPGVFAWVGRVWNARASRLQAGLLEGIPSDWGPVFDDVGGAYLPYLCANAEAWQKGHRRFDVVIQGTPYAGVRTSRYRVWCLEELRRHYETLAEPARQSVRGLLERHGCWEPLWRVTACRSGHDPDGRAPFSRGLKVF
jgi:hypothetical protein